MKHLTEEYKTLKDELAILTRKKEREENAFKSLSLQIAEPEENAFSFLMNEVSSLKHQLRNLEKSKTKIIRERTEIGISYNYRPKL